MLCHSPAHALPIPHAGQPPTTPHGLPTCPWPRLHAPRPHSCALNCPHAHPPPSSPACTVPMPCTIPVCTHPHQCVPTCPVPAGPTSVAPDTTATHFFASPCTPSADIMGQARSTG